MSDSTQYVSYDNGGLWFLFGLYGLCAPFMFTLTRPYIGLHFSCLNPNGWQSHFLSVLTINSHTQLRKRLYMRARRKSIVLQK